MSILSFCGSGFAQIRRPAASRILRWRRLAILLAFALLASGVPAQEAAATAQTLHFVQITDTHIGRAPENAQRLQRLVAAINRLPYPLAAVVHTGDIVDDCHYGSAAVQAQDLLKQLKAPFLPLPGNNDLDKATAEKDRKNWEQSFGALSRSQVIDGVRFVLFCAEPLRGNYVLSGYDPLAWLKQELQAAAEAKEPTLVFLHAPPVSDFYNNAAHEVYPPATQTALEELLNAYPPAAVICGHFHRDESHDCGKYRVLVCPPIDSRWGRQASYRLYTITRQPGGALTLTYTTQYDNP